MVCTPFELERSSVHIPERSTRRIAWTVSASGAQVIGEQVSAKLVAPPAERWERRLQRALYRKITPKNNTEE